MTNGKRNRSDIARSAQARAAARMAHPDTPERDAKAMQLRIEGHTLAEIAVRLGYANESGPSKAISRRAQLLTVASVEEDRRLWIERLEAAARGLLPKARKGDARACDSLVKVADRVSKLSGLDSKQQIELTLRERAFENLAPPALLARIRSQRERLAAAEADLLEEHPELRGVHVDDVHGQVERPDDVRSH